MNEEVKEKIKEEVEKVPEEVEETSKKVAEEVEQKEKFVNITKLKCDYTVYKRERTKLKMPVIEKCQKCGEQFKNDDELYTGYIKKDNIKQSYLICKNCAK